MSERVHDTEQLVFGSSGEGSGHPNDIVVEAIVRDASGRKSGVERVLEGWSSQGPVDLLQLDSLAHIGKKEKEVNKARILFDIRINDFYAGFRHRTGPNKGPIL